MDHEPELSVVIPVYRSAPGLPELYERLTRALSAITSDYEVVFVDDDSPDDAWSVLESFAARDSRVRLLQLMRNSGQQRAVLCGLAETRGQVVVTMDDDLQQRPEEIQLLVETLRAGDADVVFGRYPRKQHGRLRGWGTRLVKEFAFHNRGIPRWIDLTSFRAMRGQVAREVARLRNPNPVVGYLIFQVTSRATAVDVHHEPRRHGRSGYGWADLAGYFACMLMDYSDLPLRAVGVLGVALALGGFALGAGYLTAYALGSISVSGFTTLVVLVTFLSGAILMSLGIIGSYLVRVLRQGNDPSLAIVRQRKG